MFWPCETRTSTCRNFATISSGLYRFLAIAVLLDVKDIPPVGPLQWGLIRRAGQIRAGRQRENRQGARDYVTARDSRPRRRGNRMKAARLHYAARWHGGRMAEARADAADRRSGNDFRSSQA